MSRDEMYDVAELRRRARLHLKYLLAGECVGRLTKFPSLVVHYRFLLHA